MDPPRQNRKGGKVNNMWKWKIIFKDKTPSKFGEGIFFNRLVERDDNFWDKVDRVIFTYNKFLKRNSFIISVPFTLIKRWEHKIQVNSRLTPLSETRYFWYVIKLYNGQEIILGNDGNIYIGGE